MDSEYTKNHPEWKVGDTVTVVRTGVSFEKGWNNSWENEMDKAVGRTYKIRAICRKTGILLADEGSGFSFPWFVLYRVSDEVAAICDKVRAEKRTTAVKKEPVFTRKNYKRACPKWNIGELVKVTRKSKKYELGWPAEWVSKMDAAVGNTYPILAIDQDGDIILEIKDDSRYAFPHFVCELQTVLTPQCKTMPQSREDFEVGDKVRVLRRASDSERDWKNVWAPLSMDKAIGKICEIKDDNKEAGFTLDGDGGFFDYPWFVLEKVKEPTLLIRHVKSEEKEEPKMTLPKNTEEYRSMSPDYKEGDRFKVTGTARDQSFGWTAAWNPIMDEYLGKTLTVTKPEMHIVKNDGVPLKCEGRTFYFPWFVLEKVEEEPIVKKVEVKDLPFLAQLPEKPPFGSDSQWNTDMHDSLYSAQHSMLALMKSSSLDKEMMERLDESITRPLTPISFKTHLSHKPPTQHIDMDKTPIITRPTLINGVDINILSEGSIMDSIRSFNSKIENLKSLKINSKRIAAQVKEYEEAIALLVAQLDKDVPADTDPAGTAAE